MEKRIMDNKERELFWNTLCSLKGESIVEDRVALRNVIKYPEKLYRYRPISINSIEALMDNKLLFSTANYYDDPFDTFINVRISEIKRSLLEFKNLSMENASEVVSWFRRFFDICDANPDESAKIANEIKGQLENPNTIPFFEDIFRNIRNEIKKDVFSVCFSESPFNESLWLKYAEQHKGFVVEYDLYTNEKFLCGKQEKCTDCGVNKNGVSLYPVYYSETSYDATRFAQYLVACKVIGNNMNNELYSRITSVYGSQIWEREKISLIKKKVHEYDEEWRIILHGSMNYPVMMEWIPSAVYLGLNMGPNEQKLIYDIAKTAGIENVYRCYITDEGKIDKIVV